MLTDKQMLVGLRMLRGLYTGMCFTVYNIQNLLPSVKDVLQIDIEY